MKHIFTKENITTFVLVSLACAIAIIVVVPLARKFIPAARRTPSTTTPAA